jgi:cell division protein ZapE
MSQVSALSFIAAYDAAVSRGALKPDMAQRRAAEAFEVLFQKLAAPKTEGKRRWLKQKKSAANASGLYVWGDVGRGKSMLMDLFVETIQETCSPRDKLEPMPKTGDKTAVSMSRFEVRRVHFHAFMRDVHKRLFCYRQSNSGDVMLQVVAELASECTLLCLDELQVTDVTDAMIVSRLFEGLMDAGVTVIFTSNRPPRELYQGGLQREQFLVFVALLEARMPIHSLDSPQDYRLAQLKAMKRTYMFPRNAAADDFLLESWSALTQGQPNEPIRIEVDGRTLRLDKHSHGVAWLTFAELCMRPLGAADYLELCRYCHTILLQGIPKLSREDRNEAKRFVTLIDALYDHRVKLIITAETAPEGIYAHGDGTFEFARTVSRLMEMQSEKYLRLGKV